MNPIGYLFTKRIRGFRLAEVAAFGCLTVLVLGVYFSKAHAGGQTAKIDDVEQQIGEEQHRVRLLSAELAHLEEPARIERLSQDYLGLTPIDPKHETQPDDLMEIARQASSPGKAKPAPAGVVPAALPVPPAQSIQAGAAHMVSDGATR